MKTAVIYYGGFLSRRGGAYHHTESLAEALILLGWDIHIITLDNLPFGLRYLPHIIERVGNLFNLPFGFLYKSWCIKQLYRWFKNTPCDMHVFADIYISWDSHIPAVTVLHALWGDNIQAYEIKENQLIKFKQRELHILESIAHPVVTVSYPYRNYIQHDYFDKNLHKHLHVIELGVDMRAFDLSEKIVRRAKAIIFVGALEARKNVSFLLDVFSCIYSADKAYRLTIVGDGPDKSSLEAIVRERNIPVVFLGRLSRPEVIRELFCHEIYVHTSVKESFSYALLEAKLAGLRTYAFGKLEVPSAFIDVGFESFSVSTWCSSILDSSIKESAQAFEGSYYSTMRMAEETLQLALGRKERK